MAENVRRGSVKPVPAPAAGNAAPPSAVPVDAAPRQPEFVTPARQFAEAIIPPPGESQCSSAAGEMLVTFEVTRGPHAGLKREFDRHESFLIGRSAEAQLCLSQDGHFSRNHLRIEVTPPHCYLVDLGSNNGTMVNGRKVLETSLADGDVIAGGRTEIRVSVTRRELPADDHEGTIDFAPVAATRATALPGPPAVAAIADAGPPSVLQIARYELLAELGRGSMGIVYRARQRSTGEQVALKVILPTHVTSRERLQLFVREASILSRLSHPYIIRFLEMGTTGDQFFVVTEYIDAVLLQQVLKNEPRPSQIRICCGIACRILDALKYAHAQSLVHRDIKPANILLTRHGKKLRAKLADFGLAKNYEDAGFSGMTTDSETRGSPAYMSPEQIVSSRYAKPSCDLYSLGVTLYQYITGRLPFHADTGRKALRAILEDPPIPIRDVCPEVPEGLALAIERALAKDPALRYASAAEMYEALYPYSQRERQSAIHP